MCLEECWGLPGARIAAHDGGMGSRMWIGGSVVPLGRSPDGSSIAAALAAASRHRGTEDLGPAGPDGWS